MRGNFINTVFEGGYSGLELFISSNCKRTIEDYLYLKEDSDGTKLKERMKDVATGVTCEKYGHCSDAKTTILYVQHLQVSFLQNINAADLI